MAKKRELIEPTPGDKRYVRRDKEGRFKDVVDLGPGPNITKRAVKGTIRDLKRRMKPTVTLVLDLDTIITKKVLTGVVLGDYAPGTILFGADGSAVAMVRRSRVRSVDFD